jgi:hypothetical protein
MTMGASREARKAFENTRHCGHSSASQGPSKTIRLAGRQPGRVVVRGLSSRDDMRIMVPTLYL